MINWTEWLEQIRGYRHVAAECGLLAEFDALCELLTHYAAERW